MLMAGVPGLGARFAWGARTRGPFLVRRIGGGRTIRIVGTLLHAGFEVGESRLQRLDPRCLLLDDGEVLDDQVLHDEGRLLPGSRVQRKPFWKRQRVGHSILPWLMNGPTAGASTAVVIAKNPAKGQSLMNGIPLGVILTGDPLNNYKFFRCKVSSRRGVSSVS